MGNPKNRSRKRKRKPPEKGISLEEKQSLRARKIKKKRESSNTSDCSADNYFIIMNFGIIYAKSIF